MTTAKVASFVALLALLLTVVDANAQQKPTTAKKAAPHAVSIRYGWSSGMCYGYCAEELNVSTGDAVLMKLSNDIRYRDLRVEADLSGKHWRELARLADYDVFAALPEKIGCPGCVDEPVEYIEVRYSDRSTKSVLYNAGGAPGGNPAMLAEKLSALMAKLEKDIPQSMAPKP